MADRSALTDEQLLSQASRGDEQAFVTLYHRKHGPLYRFVLQMSGSAELAEEVAQDVFLELIRGAARYDAARGSVAAWLYGVARHHMLKRLERERRYLPLERESPDGEEMVNVEPVATDDVLGDLTRGEALEALRQAILALPWQYREIVVLCDVQELSYEEAARLSGCALGTVRSRLHRARALLVERLRPVRCGR